MKTETLPDKLSDLLELALDDLETTEKDPAYEINMLYWHELDEVDNTCRVCLAGAVLAQTLEVPVSFNYLRYRPEPDLEDKMDAINFVRLGFVDYALKALNRASFYEVGKDRWRIEVPQYYIDPKRFKKTLRNLVPELRAKGY